MKKKDLKDWKSKTILEINNEIIGERKKLGSLRLELISGKVKNIKSIRTTRRSIAQLLTLKQALEISSKNQ